MFKVSIEEPNGGRREVLCSDVDQCIDVVQFEGKTSEPWTLIKLHDAAGKEMATWGVGPRGRMARKPPRMRRPMR